MSLHPPEVRQDSNVEAGLDVPSDQLYEIFKTNLETSNDSFYVFHSLLLTLQSLKKIYRVSQ